jgi:hypothetical protein
MPKYNLRNIRIPDGIQVIGVETVAQAVLELRLHKGER